MNRSPKEALREIVERVSHTIKEGVTVDAFLAGGMATYVHTADKIPSKDESRYSEDADIHFMRGLSLPDEVVVTYQDHAGKERALMLDRNYTSAIGLCHPDAFDRATPLFNSGNGRVRLKILTPLDLAITKVGRFQDHDRFDIGLLARCGLLDADEFSKRAYEAVDYLATDPAAILSNIRDAAELIRRASTADN
jgi:hypothetical protein